MPLSERSGLSHSPNPSSVDEHSHNLPEAYRSALSAPPWPPNMVSPSVGMTLTQRPTTRSGLDAS